MRDLVKVFRALSDETRIRILKVLLERECCVCEIMQAGVPRATCVCLEMMALLSPRETGYG
ncbi:MAG: ArsR/SmtB family transcription factor [Dehalococcoidia bacterium]